MNLETMGIFWVGGETIDRTQPEQKANKIVRNQAYVEYFVPKNIGKTTAPIVLTHTTASGAVFRTTPDGREGWAEYFVRAGHPVFIVDPPGTGRAGFEIDDVNMSARGESAPMTADPLIRYDSSHWQHWNLGPRLGMIPQDSATPNSADAIKHFMSALMPGRALPKATLDAALIATLEKVQSMFGPAVFICWSSAGGLGQRVVVARPELVRGLVLIEGYNGQLPLPTAENWFDYGPLDPPDAIVDTLASKNIPLLSLNGQSGHEINTGRSKHVGQTLIDMVKAKGGDATGIFLPDIGITGNSHMMFWDRNSDDIAKVIEDWIQGAVQK